MKTVCIVCPVGCSLEIEKKGEELVVTGNGCNRGIEYGKSEFVCPKRILTALVVGENQICSVKTTLPVEKAKIKEVLKMLKQAPKKKYHVGEIVFNDIFEKGCNVVITSINEN